MHRRRAGRPRLAIGPLQVARARVPDLECRPIKQQIADLIDNGGARGRLVGLGFALPVETTIRE